MISAENLYLQYLLSTDRQAIQRVRELHSPWRNKCGDCDQPYPCDTVRILDGEQL